MTAGSPRGFLAQRIEWVNADPKGECWPGGPSREKYLAGFTRPSGSFVEGITSLADLDRFFDRLGNVTEVEHSAMPKGTAQADCRYWVGTVPDGYNAFEGVVVAGDLTDEELAQCRLVRGPHGVEVRLDFPPRPTRLVCLITDGDGLVTWFPGKWTAGLPQSDAFPVKAAR